MPMEALINTCELLGVDPREVFNAAYRRLIEEMGEYNPASTGERFVVDGQSPEAGHEDIDIDAWADRIKAEDKVNVE